MPTSFRPFFLTTLAVTLSLANLESRGDDAADAKVELVGKEAGQVRDDNGLKMKLVWCPPGVVRMEGAIPDANGAIAESKPVRALVSRGYWLGQYEVTQAEWRQLRGTEPWSISNAKEGDDHPASSVGWLDALRFCVHLTKVERSAGRLPPAWEYNLPTEVQWERACRARTETRFAFGDDASELGEYAWFHGNTVRGGEPYGHQVGQKKPNAWNLHDMHGNVFEWCQDCYADSPPGGRDPVINAMDPKQNRVIRGGAWNVDERFCTSSVRGVAVPTVCRHFIGFRVALVPVHPAANAPALSAEPAP